MLLSLNRISKYEMSVSVIGASTYSIDYGDGTPLTSSTQHTYAQSGNYLIKVTTDVGYFETRANIIDLKNTWIGSSLAIYNSPDTDTRRVRRPNIAKISGINRVFYVKETSVSKTGLLLSTAGLTLTITSGSALYLGSVINYGGGSMSLPASSTVAVCLDPATSEIVLSTSITDNLLDDYVPLALIYTTGSDVGYMIKFSGLSKLILLREEQGGGSYGPTITVMTVGDTPKTYVEGDNLVLTYYNNGSMKRQTYPLLSRSSWSPAPEYTTSGSTLNYREIFDGVSVPRALSQSVNEGLSITTEYTSSYYPFEESIGVPRSLSSSTGYLASVSDPLGFLAGSFILDYNYDGQHNFTSAFLFPTVTYTSPATSVAITEYRLYDGPDTVLATYPYTHAGTIQPITLPASEVRLGVVGFMSVTSGRSEDIPVVIDYPLAYRVKVDFPFDTIGRPANNKGGSLALSCEIPRLSSAASNNFLEITVEYTVSNFQEYDNVEVTRTTSSAVEDYLLID